MKNQFWAKERCQEIQGDGHAQCSYMLIAWDIKSQIGKIGIFWNVFLHTFSE